MIHIQWSVFRTVFLLCSIGFLISACGDQPCSQIDIPANSSIPQNITVAGRLPTNTSCSPYLVEETNPKDLLDEEQQQKVKDQFALTDGSTEE